jgi:lipoprotein-anchoring transpeptidase ErfK/SrfK
MIHLLSTLVALTLAIGLAGIPASASENAADGPTEVQTEPIAPEPTVPEPTVPEPEPEPAVVKPPAKTAQPLRLPLKQGQRGARIGLLHERLVWLGASISSESLKLDRFGKSTTSAVQLMQSKYGLRSTGIVDERTWSTIAKMAGKLDVVPSRCRTGTVVCIDKTSKVVRLVQNGKVAMTLDARFGKAGYETREGTFRVTRKSRDHVSNTYFVWMPYALFFAGGQAVHFSPTFRRIGHVSGSHGCVNLRDIDDARKLFDRVPVGSTVVVYRSGT